MLMEYVFILFLVFLMGVCLWGAFGLLLLPVFASDMITFCFASGEGKQLEMRARAYGWLRDTKSKGGTLVIVDCGLSAQGLEIVQRLREKMPWLDYCPHQTLPDYIELLQHCLEKEENV